MCWPPNWKSGSNYTHNIWDLCPEQCIPGTATFTLCITQTNSFTWSKNNEHFPFEYIKHTAELRGDWLPQSLLICLNLALLAAWFAYTSWPSVFPPLISDLSQRIKRTWQIWELLVHRGKPCYRPLPSLKIHMAFVVIHTAAPYYLSLYCMWLIIFNFTMCIS